VKTIKKKYSRNNGGWVGQEALSSSGEERTRWPLTKGGKGKDAADPLSKRGKRGQYMAMRSLDHQGRLKNQRLDDSRRRGGEKSSEGEPLVDKKRPPFKKKKRSIRRYHGAEGGVLELRYLNKKRRGEGNTKVSAVGKVS